MADLRQTLIDKLNDWQSGKITAAQMHEWAEANRFAQRDLPGEQWDGVYNEVIGDLDMLDMNLIVAADAPLYIDILQTCLNDLEAAAKIRVIDAARNVEQRKVELKDDPVYAPYCV